eukprot:3111563-Amphidinium_carterae.1
MSCKSSWDARNHHPNALSARAIVISSFLSLETQRPPQPSSRVCLTASSLGQVGWCEGGHGCGL